MLIGAQLYIYSDLADKAAEDALPDLASAGFRAVETILGRAPLTPHPRIPILAVHGGLKDFLDVPATIKAAKEAGASYLCSSGPLEWFERSPDDYRRTAAVLNELGEHYLGAGLRILYHNHEFEFSTLEDGDTGWMILRCDLDPRFTGWCFDAGWAARAGLDAAQCVKDLGDRLHILHLRDFEQDGTSCPLGFGSLDLKPVVKAALRISSLASIMVEQDPGTKTPTADLIVGRVHLEKVHGI